jgi:hypothetical protein
MSLIELRDVRKIYRLGEIEIRALVPPQQPNPHPPDEATQFQVEDELNRGKDLARRDPSVARHLVGDGVRLSRA